MIQGLTPNNPQFKAMERDIEERHKRMVEQRQASGGPSSCRYRCPSFADGTRLQVAERCRVRGNDAFKAGRFAEAYQQYSLGLESQKTNMTLHANAAMASLKMGCFVQVGPGAASNPGRAQGVAATAR